MEGVAHDGLGRAFYVIDADERVTPALASEIGRLLADAPALRGYVLDAAGEPVPAAG